MLDFEQLGAFYLGKQYDLPARQLQDDLLLYDSKDLTTHAVCVGMTGSGKTGLCLALLEEAAIDGIPAIAIDPKGDLGNLLLTFPELRPADFEPWVDSSAAAQAGKTTAEVAAETADRWRQGLADWGQQPERIARFRDAVDIAIYTPGSTAGLPLTVLRSFDAPPPAVRDDLDLMRERITAAVSGLLGLLGINADPVRSREHILLSNLLDHHWRKGESLDIAGLIRAIQSPPFATVGVMDLESFYPSKARGELALALNNLLASPSFAGWMEGEALDIQRLLYTAEGQPRLSIISIAHLSEPERMFFVTLLLSEVLAWVRSQGGTSSLRALLYMDEIFGYFPPVANPPSKRPMLTLLKQARAYGMGVVLATQNPVDLDYKGLSNTGTWFIGRLQTERDKARVLEGLEGASAEAGASFDRARMEQTLAGLGQRVFLMNNVHENAPIVFQTRWVLSYLRGPLTRDQIRALMEPRKAAQQRSDTKPPVPPIPPGASASSGDKPQGASQGGLLLPNDLFDTPSAASERAAETPVASPEASAATTQTSAVVRPLLPIEANEQFAACPTSGGNSAPLVYCPALFMQAKLHYVKSPFDIDAWQTGSWLQPIRGTELPTPTWQAAVAIDPQKWKLTEQPQAGAQFSEMPAELLRGKTYASLVRQGKDWLYQTQKLTVWRSSDLEQTSRPGETESEFRIRLSQLAREKRDEAKERLQERYSSKFTTLAGRIRTAEARVTREQGQFQQASLDTTVSLGESIFGSIFGRKIFSRTNASKVSRTVRGVGKARQQQADVAKAEAALADLREQKAELEQQLRDELAQIAQQFQPDQLALAQERLGPRKGDLLVEKVSLVWVPAHLPLSTLSEC